MDKRYQVFVSSTYADLKEERQHVMQALMEMDCIPAGMELFPAADEEQWEFCASSQAPAWEFGEGSSSFPSREARASLPGFPSWSLGTSVLLNLMAVTRCVGTR